MKLFSTLEATFIYLHESVKISIEQSGKKLLSQFLKL